MNNTLNHINFNNLKYRKLDGKERADFFEIMSLMLVGLKNSFGIYYDEVGFNKLLIQKADYFLKNDKKIITDKKVIKNTFDDWSVDKIVLLKNPDINKPWKFGNRLRNVQFAMATGLFSWDEDDGRYSRAMIGINEDNSIEDSKPEDDFFVIEEIDINKYIKAIIPSSHELVRESLRQISIGRYFKRYYQKENI